MERVLEGEDFGFLSPLRYVRNDRFGVLRSVYVMRVFALATWNENGVFA